MARKVDAFPPENRRYPWDEWLDGSVWELARGEDYESSASVVIAARVAAAIRGKRVRSHIAHQPERIYLQARSAS